MMQIKTGSKRASLIGLKPQMVVALQVIDQVFTAMGYPVTITSGTEGKHGKSSKHFIGHAVDIRTLQIGIEIDEAKVLAKEIQRCLGDEFYVLAEANHLHVQFSPQVGVNA